MIEKWLSFTLFLLLAAMVGCSGGESDNIYASKQIVLEGEEMVVTRVVPAVPLLQAATPVPERDEVVLDVSRSGSPGVPDPQRAETPNELDLVENLFVGLTRFNHETDEAEPELAERWEISPDGLTWTFHLRPGFFWIKPGFVIDAGFFASPREPEIYRPVLADDVVFAVQRACNSATQTPKVLVLFIVEGCEAVHTRAIADDAALTSIGIEAPDDRTVVVHLTKPASYLSIITSMSLFRPVPRELVTPFAGKEESWTAPENIVTSGPFVMGIDTVDNTRTTLRRNPFWSQPFAGTVDVVNIYWLDSVSAYEMWLEKGLDVSPLPAGQLEEVMNDSRLWPRLHLVSNQAVFYLAYNFDSPVFSDSAVRRAFSAAIDRDALLEEVYGSEGLALRHFTPPGVFGAPPVDLIGIGFNSDLARLEMDASSLRSCAFLPPIRYMVGATDLALFHAETVRGMWQRELGCPEENIVIEQVQFGTLLASTRPDAGAERPDIWDLGWASYFPDAHNWLGDVLHCTISENRQNRPCGQMDDLIAQAAVVRESEERINLYRDAERLLFGEGGSQPIAPLFVQGDYVMIQPWLEYAPAQFGGEQFDTYNLDATVKRLERQL